VFRNDPGGGPGARSDVEEWVALFEHCAVSFELGGEAFELGVSPLQICTRSVASIRPAPCGKLVTPGG
jgi:hypothetical protein